MVVDMVAHEIQVHLGGSGIGGCLDRFKAEIVGALAKGRVGRVRQDHFGCVDAPFGLEFITVGKDGEQNAFGAARVDDTAGATTRARSATA